VSGASAGGAAVEVDRLVKSYGGRAVLEDASFTVSPGSLVGLLGPNGAGKTTTVEILEGYRSADGGRTRVLGLDPAVDGERLRPRVGVMLQVPGLAPLATARELVRLFARYFAAPDDPDGLLEAVGLGTVAGSRVRTLSGGERQRLGLAHALVGRPEVLILDEPTAGMDPAAKQATRALLDERRRAGVAILLTTHELADVERLADRVVVLDRGRVVADAPPSELAGGAARVLRFRLAAPLPDDDCVGLSRAIGARVAGEPGDWLRVDDGDSSPAVVAALAAWCAERGLAITELRVGGGTLEERYLELVGERGAAE
jgi:ABC-2 type transport system ATP-binding protein